MNKAGFLFQPLLAILLIFICALMTTAQTTNNKIANKESRKIIELIERLADAGINRDVKIVAEIYSDNYFHTNADGSIMTVSDVLKSYETLTNVKIESNTHDEDKIQINGDTAVFNTRIVYKGTVGAQPFSRVYRVTYFLKKSKRWRIIASHASIIDPAK